MSYKDTTKHDAKGKWFGILTALGIGSNYLTGKHTQCPICGGRDRFRWDNKEGDGTWFCNQDGAGDGFSLLIAYHKIDFKEAKKRVKEVIGSVEQVEIKKEQTDEQKRDALRKAWNDSKPSQKGDFVDLYLRGRGIDVPVLYGLRSGLSVDFTTGREFQTMFGVVKNRDGKLATLHRTFIENGRKADIECPRKMMSGFLEDGCSIQTGEVMEIGMVGIAEGIETALSASQMFHIPVWSVLNTSLMEKWLPPEGVSTVVIFGDNDKSYSGQKSAYTLARKLTKLGYAIEVNIPKKQGYDWNDCLLEEMGKVV